MFVRSAIVRTNGSSFIDDHSRTSTTAYLRCSQTSVIKCIEQRFAQFQGNINPLRLELLQVVKYEHNQELKPHINWFYHANQMINEFINIKFNFSLHSRFCNILLCNDIAPYRGIRFRPIPGNSIFWSNQ
ncbi:unnamed protein product [Rotaria sp. Silwood1]|nr:unnamed protein product [Rotaria sp. Silwood1]CAF1375643.1 unnamed protein product [Rotaria sp. Silwood1]CAF3558365.1 unnamed protein product [Rotaria sp. Silwood1]CAF4674846.1 unnamed protein product [Rotaria sp. Silwood1]